MATQANIRQRILHNLYSLFPGSRPFETFLGASYASGATSITVDDGTDWAGGDYLENPGTGELFVVESVAANVLTVQGAQEGTSNAASAGNNDLVRQNPRFSIQEIDDAITDALQSLEAWGIHAWGTGSLTLASPLDQYYYDITETDVVEPYGVMAVYYAHDTTQEPVQLPFRTYNQMSTSPTEWAAARGIRLAHFGDRVAGDTVYYTYAQKIDAVTDLLARQDILVTLGATALLAGMAILPDTQDPGSRSNRTVPPGQVGRDGRWYQGEFFVRVKAETALLSVARRHNFPGYIRTRRALRWRP